MKVTKTMNGKKTLKRMLMLCLCLALMLGSACAGSVVEFTNSTGQPLDFQCALPDGRLLLTGAIDPASGVAATVERIVCMNPDGTVSWEYTGEAKEYSYRGCYDAAVLADGTVAAVVIDESPDGMAMTAKFFTPDGQPTGKETAFESNLAVHAAKASYLMMSMGSIEGNRTEVFDWDGNKRFAYDGLVISGGYGSIAEGDDLVLCGSVAETDSKAVILKLDGVQDKALWRTELDFQWPDTKDAELYNAVKTTDGGYVATLREMSGEVKDDIYQYRQALVKFDAEGRVQWVNKDIVEDKGNYRLAAYDGKIMMYPGPRTDMDWPQVLRWLDESGKELGTTELTVQSEECPELKKYLAKQGSMMMGCLEMIPEADGLWAVAPAYTVDENDCCDVSETIMFKIPELQ
ncbi:MAG: hypothetical protein IKS46_07500 [Clostridia bacterium]|nr:hypothetical protein [Clostridia bacterium]